MSAGPGSANVYCPVCGEGAIAIVPKDSKVTEDEDDADGSVKVDCHNCGNQFRVFFRANR